MSRRSARACPRRAAWSSPAQPRAPCRLLSRKVSCVSRARRLLPERRISWTRFVLRSSTETRAQVGGWMFVYELPEIGEGVVEGEIVKWLLKVGDPVAVDQPLCEIMTDKATVEISSPRA